MTRKSTIRDVAKEAGVSVATVSRILNDKSDVSEETRLRVEHAIGKLGYARSTQWQQLTTGKSRVISLHFPDTQANANPVYLDFITGATAACEERDYRLHLITRSLDESQLLNHYRTNMSDGTILMKVQLQDWRVDLLREQQLPFVMIGRTENNEGTSFIDYDFEAAVEVAINHLVGLGHQNIAYVSTVPSQVEQHGPTVRALQGYKNTCAKLGLPLLYQETDQDLQNVRLTTSYMLSKHPEITAFVTVKEMVEAAIYGAVQDSGLRIPDDISVVGLTNPQGTQLITPALTALDFPAWLMAYEAGSMLVDQLTGINTAPRQILREPTLTVRASTGPVSQVGRHTPGERRQQ
jgi:DNA-binding LacI/PurR family transcriptional regulator